MSYRVKLNSFEGPFDLLVYLIEHARMSIYDIKISEITTQYMSYVDKLQETDVNLASEFMVLASELLEIKSKLLLPRIKQEDESAEIYEDPRTELVEKLKEYKKYKASAAMLEARWLSNSLSIEKPQDDLSEYTNEPDEFLILDAAQFKTAFESFLLRKKKLEEIHAHHIRTEKQRVTTELRIANLKEIFSQLPAGQRKDFYDLVESNGDKYDISVTFASILELMKERRLDADQKKLFGNIEVYATDYLMADNPEEERTTDNGQQDN